MLKKIRVLITFTSVLSLINGIAYLIFTQPSLRLLGIDATEFGMLMTRYYGACAIGYGVLLWQVKQVDSPQVYQAALFSILILLGPSSIVGLFGVINGVFNRMGWLLVSTDLLLSAASAILFYIQRNS